MSVEIHKPSGAKMAPFFQPVEIIEIGNPGQPTDVIIHNGRLTVYDATGNTTIDGGIIQTQGIVVGLKSWAHDVPFTATDEDTVTWAATGKVYFGDGTSTEIDAGTTGNMGAKTYVYYNGTATLQTTTTIATALGDSVRLVAILEPQASDKATITTLHQAGNTVHADQVVAGRLIAERLSVGPGCDYTSDYNPILKVNTFVQNGIPTSIAIGDLWFDSNDKNKLYIAESVGADEITAGEWVTVRDTDIAQAITDAAGAQATADGKVITFYQDAIPTSEGIGDLWVDTNDGNKLYRAESAGADEITAGEWVEIQDADIAQAIADAATAQSTADSKIVTFYQDGVPTATDVGDLWIDTNDNNKLYRSTNVGDNEVIAGEWEAVPDENKLDILGGSYDTASSGARVRLFPDANTGIVVNDDAAAEVFKVMVGGTDVGDVTLGNFAGNKGLKWDKSATTFVVRGTLHAADISVGGTIEVAMNLGVSNVKLDGANKRVVINDGTNDRILIGYDSGGF